MLVSVKPILSVIIATYNSEKTLPLVLSALKEQSIDKRKMEILLLDGGSKDSTKKIGREFGCQIINNPRTEPVYAKFLGYKKAKGKYIVYLDHDEVLQNPDSFKIRINCLEKEKDVKCVLVSGYRNPHGYPFINEYINEFGDPFSCFIYRLSKSADFFLSSMSKKYRIVKDTTKYTIFSLKDIKTMPIIELCAAATMTDKRYMQAEFPETMDRPDLIPHFFYLLLSKSPKVAITKEDTILHYSADTLGKYLNKIRWRVKNNIYHIKDMGMSGFTGRNTYNSFFMQQKKYLFLPYVYSFFPLFLDTVYLIYTRRNIGYILHIPLSLFTANLIVYHTFIKLLGRSQVLKSYDESKTVSIK